jgi:hypothetical protein
VTPPRRCQSDEWGRAAWPLGEVPTWSPLRHVSWASTSRPVARRQTADALRTESAGPPCEARLQPGASFERARALRSTRTGTKWRTGRSLKAEPTRTWASRNWGAPPECPDTGSQADGASTAPSVTGSGPRPGIEGERVGPSACRVVPRCPPLHGRGAVGRGVRGGDDRTGIDDDLHDSSGSVLPVHAPSQEVVRA